MSGYLETKNLSVGYHGKPLIEDVSLCVQRGKIVTLIGPNGSGKSTILKTVIGQLPELSGTVYLDGETMRSRSRNDVARDRAFCFYYEDSLELLRRLGAELVPFSPLSDERLPEDLHGLYLGGGYPELYAERLEANAAIRASIRAAVERGLPCVAECGGFMYLTQSIAGHAMAGVLSGSCFDAGKLTRFGYATLTAQRDSMLFAAGEQIPAHEFHRWDAENPGEDFLAEKPSGRSWRCAYAGETLYAGYPHFHFYANLSAAVRFVEACRKEKHRYE